MLMATSTEDYGKARAMATDAVQSRAYLYPIKVKRLTQYYRHSSLIDTGLTINAVGNLLLHRPPKPMAAIA